MLRREQFGILEAKLDEFFKSLNWHTQLLLILSRIVAI